MFNLKSYFYSIKNAGLKTLLLVMASSVLTFTIALAASGDLDPTFGGDGKVTTNIGGALVNDAAWGLAIQSDGKIVAVGGHNDTMEVGGQSDFAVVRYKANGTLDTTFHGDGKLTQSFGIFDEATHVAIQSNGKIVVIGNTCATGYTNCDLAMVRYNSNGSLDNTFSGDGKVVVDFGGGDNNVNALAIQADGRIVVVGGMHNGSNYDFAVHRFLSNGTLDTTFSVDGMVNTGFGSGRNDSAVDLAIKSGKIVVAGQTCSDTDCDFALARFNSNGTLDTTFSSDGKVTTNIMGNDYGRAVAIQGNGKIVVAGRPSMNECRFLLARYNTNGSLDTTFSGDGKVITNFPPGSSCGARGMKIQSDGKIVVVGWTGSEGDHDLALARYRGNGSLDNTFNLDGRLATNFGGDDSGFAIAFQTDGRIIVAGVTDAGAGGDDDFALARYLP